MRDILEVRDRVVIAGGREPRSRALAAIQLLANGDLLVAYRDASNHPVGDHEIIDDGAVMTARSTDSGRTWGEPRAVCAAPGWDCTGGRSMVQTPDGDLIMFVMKARRAGRKYPESHVFPTWSTDNGHTWGPFGPELSLFRERTEPNTQGRIDVLSDGRWMMSAYGSDYSAGPVYPVAAFSNDDGRTWGDRRVIARGSDIRFYDSVTIRLRDGRFLAVTRTDDPPFTSYRSYSDDEGRTWTVPEPLPFSGQTQSLVGLRPGTVLCAYRDRDPARPGVSASVTNDGGASWEFAGQLYTGTHWNCGYPSLVRLPGGTLFCVYYSAYEAGNCEVQGVFIAERE